MLTLMRHGQSIWNAENRFTGMIDIPLTDIGRNEAHLAGKILHNMKFNMIYTSNLSRAIETAEIVKTTINSNASVVQDASLNERDYGDLIGMNKNSGIKIYVEEQFN